ncbi:MAG: hypothetical protein M3126_00610 [Candidatus Eremiobacteraeota bacterium]|nr:hypothetical protein [Candidatus Eremiobacteraeota bacterium]
MPKLRHQYDSTRHAKLGGADFFVDTWVESRVPGDQMPADMRPLEAFILAKGYRVPAGIHSPSDQEHIETLIRAHGYTIPAGLMSVRLVHLLDQGRKELMIIYSEDVAATGYTAAELRKTGKASARWRFNNKVGEAPAPSTRGLRAANPT